MKVQIGDTVRDNVTGLRGRVVNINRGGVVVNRGPLGQAPDTRHYTWRAAYEWVSPGHRRLEVVRTVPEPSEPERINDHFERQQNGCYVG